MNGFTAEKAIQKLKDYDQAEVYVSDTTVHTIYIDNSRISNIESKRDVGMMFRMTDGGRMGKASVTLNGEYYFNPQAVGTAGTANGDTATLTRIDDGNTAPYYVEGFGWFAASSVTLAG